MLAVINIVYLIFRASLPLYITGNVELIPYEGMLTTPVFDCANLIASETEYPKFK